MKTDPAVMEKAKPEKADMRITKSFSKLLAQVTKSEFHKGLLRKISPYEHPHASHYNLCSVQKANWFERTLTLRNTNKTLQANKFNIPGKTIISTE